MRQIHRDGKSRDRVRLRKTVSRSAKAGTGGRLAAGWLAGWLAGFPERADAGLATGATGDAGRHMDS